MGVFSALGVGFLLETTWLFPLTAAFLVLALVVMAREVWKKRVYAPLCLGLISSAGILMGKFHLESDTVMYGAMVLFFLAAIWSILPVRRRAERKAATPRVIEASGSTLELTDRQEVRFKHG